MLARRAPCSRAGKSAASAMKPPSPCTGSSTTQATVAGSTSALKSCSRPAIASSRRDAAVRVRRRRAVDLGRERPEAGLVGLDLARSSSSSAACGRGRRCRRRRRRAGRSPTRAILTAFSIASAPELTSSDFCSLARARRELGEPAADLDVRLVDADHEALVEVAVDLLVDRVDDGREAVAGVLAADAAGEVEVRAAVDVGDARAVGARDDEPRRRDAARDVARALGEDAVVGAGVGRGHARGVLHHRTRASADADLAMRSPRAGRASDCVACVADRRVERQCGVPHPPTPWRLRRCARARELVAERSLVPREPDVRERCFVLGRANSCCYWRFLRPRIARAHHAPPTKRHSAISSRPS